MLRIRPVSDLDVHRLWQWANEPSTRASSFRPEPISWDDHLAWFGRKSVDPGCRMYILEADGLPAGQVRFEINSAGQAEVAISIAVECRSRGYGAKALRLGAARVFADTGTTELVAYIKPDNVASIRAFENAGFVAEGRSHVGGHDAIRMTRPRGVSP